jgi:putative transposase
MARHPRFVLIGHPQHLIIRGNNREPIFISDVLFLP